MKPTVLADEIAAIAKSEHRDPFGVLGMHAVYHEGERAIVVRVHFTDAEEAYVYAMAEEKLYPMARVPGTGFFEAIFPGQQDFFRYPPFINECIHLASPTHIRTGNHKYAVVAVAFRKGTNEKRKALYGRNAAHEQHELSGSNAVFVSESPRAGKVVKRSHIDSVGDNGDS